MNREKLIQDFLNGRLNEQELAEFDALYKTDAGFREEVEFQKDLKASFSSVKRDELKTKLQGFEEELKSKGKVRHLKTDKPTSSYKKWLAAACILVIVGIGLMYFFDKPTANEIYFAHFKTYENVVNPITRGETGKNLADSSFISYEKGEYKKAAEGFAQLFSETGKSYYLLYEANAYLAYEKPEKAIPLLEKQLSYQDEFSEKSKWYLALAYLKTGEIEKAKTLFEEIKVAGSYKAEEAGEIIKDL